MGIFSKEIGSKINELDEEFAFIMMAKSIKENGLIIFLMAKEFLKLRKTSILKENSQRAC